MTKPNRIDWMKTGAEHTKDRHEQVEEIISRMEWDSHYIGKQIAMMPALAIQAAIKEFRIPRVSAVSYNCHEFAPFGLYGIEGNYTNGKVRIFIVDEGSHLVPICAYVWDEN